LEPSFWLGGARFVADLLRGGWRFWRRNKRKLTASEVVQLRHKSKSEFEERITERKRQGLRSDVIVRDVRRLDSYPDGNVRKGISPWFKVGLMGTYHRGILAGLSWEGLIDDENGGWRLADRRTGEIRSLRAILIGYIPFEMVEAVDWAGDEIYSFPHIFCYFDAKSNEPYVKIAYCEERHLALQLSF